MNTESIEGKLFEGGDEAAAHGPGAFCWAEDESHIYIIMPGHKHLDAIAVTRDPELREERTWLLTGTREKPTLSPSLDSRGVWHGYLRAGRFESC